MKIVRTFATSANLGPGFDCLGICFDLYNEYEFFFPISIQLKDLVKNFQILSTILLLKVMKKFFIKE